MRVIEKVLSSAEKLKDVQLLPRSPVGPEFEMRASSVFVEQMQCKGRAYGTRSQIVLAARQSGEVHLFERNRELSGEWTEQEHSYIISGIEPPASPEHGAEL